MIHTIVITMLLHKEVLVQVWKLPRNVQKAKMEGGGESETSVLKEDF